MAMQIEPKSRNFKAKSKEEKKGERHTFIQSSTSHATTLVPWSATRALATRSFQEASHPSSHPTMDLPDWSS